MEARVVARISIEASPAEIFTYLTNLKYHFLWNPHLRSVKPITILKLGVKYNSSSWLLGVKVHGTNVVTKLTPNKEIELKNSTGALSYLVNYQLRVDQKRTFVFCRTIVASDSQAFAFTTPLLKLLARRELQSDLQALKIAVEQKLT